MKNKPSKKKKPASASDFPTWQAGEYDRAGEFNFNLPQSFLAICKLTGVTPRNMLIDFMDNLACSSWKREGREKPKEKLIDYFLEMGYGQEIYTVDDIRQMFKEMDAVGLLWPEKGKIKLIDLYALWRDKHEKYWFKKWFRKPRRQLLKNEKPL